MQSGSPRHRVTRRALAAAGHVGSAISDPASRIPPSGGRRAAIAPRPSRAPGGAEGAPGRGFCGAAPRRGIPLGWRVRIFPSGLSNHQTAGAAGVLRDADGDAPAPSAAPYPDSAAPAPGRDRLRPARRRRATRREPPLSGRGVPRPEAFACALRRRATRREPPLFREGRGRPRRPRARDPLLARRKAAAPNAAATAAFTTGGRCGTRGGNARAARQKPACRAACGAARRPSGAPRWAAIFFPSISVVKGRIAFLCYEIYSGA